MMPYADYVRAVERHQQALRQHALLSHYYALCWERSMLVDPPLTDEDRRVLAMFEE